MSGHTDGGQPVRIALVGASGRVGRALKATLAERHDVSLIERADLGPDQQPMLRGRLADADVVVNAAGVAHLDGDPTPADMARLVTANVLLPMELAEAALATGTPLIHISSSKATSRRRGAYAWSKRAGEDVLVATFHDRLVRAGVAVAVVRPPAMLFPPFDAGKLRWLRNLDRVPGSLTPPVPLPIVAPDRFVDRIEALARDGAEGRLEPGVSFVEFARDERGTLVDVRDAVRQQRRPGATGE